MLIINGRLVTWEQENQVLDGQAVYIDDGTIVEIGPESELREKYPKIKIVIMTSDRDGATYGELESIDDTVDGFLHKPFDKDILNICLDVVLVKGGRFRHKKQETFY